MVANSAEGIDYWANFAGDETEVKDKAKKNNRNNPGSDDKVKSKAQAKLKAKAKATHVTPKADPNKAKDVIEMERNAKELITNVSVARVTYDKHKEDAARRPLAWGWSKEMFEDWAKVQAEFHTETLKLGTFYTDYKSRAASAKQVMELKKKYKEQRQQRPSHNGMCAKSKNPLNTIIQKCRNSKISKVENLEKLVLQNWVHEKRGPRRTGSNDPRKTGSTNNGAWIFCFSLVGRIPTETICKAFARRFVPWC